MTRAERHAQRLLRCYPPVWRERYGPELLALLLDDLAERPRSLPRDADVVRAGLHARLAACGLASGPVRDGPAVRFTLAAASTVFVAAAVSIWTQLADGRLTARPGGALAATSLVALSLGLGVLSLAATVVGVRLAVAVVRTVRGGRGAEVLRPMALLVAGAAVLVGGLRLVVPLWPGARLGRHGLLASAARTGWAATDPISTFWLHPHRFFLLPAVELAWMFLCPAAVGVLVWAAVRLGQVCSVHVPRAGGRPWSVGGLAALPGLLAAAAWVVGSQHAADATYRAGTLDLVLVAAMLTAALAGRNALVARATRPG